MKTKFTKISLIVILVISILLLIYNIGFQLDYMVTYKYTVDNGFSSKDIVYPKSDRGAEINYLLTCSKVIMGYLVLVTAVIIFWLYNNKKQK